MRTKTVTKQAMMGGDQDQPFEESFASLAHKYIQDKAPSLLEHLVGFQLVDKSDDANKAMGIFGFNVGDEWMYVPIFYLNGEFKGHELLYLQNHDKFVPLKENWISFLMNKKPHVLGEPSDPIDGVSGKKETLPDLDSFLNPGNYKSGSAKELPHVYNWAKPVLFKWASAFYGDIDVASLRKRAKSIPDLPDLLAVNLATIKKAHSMYENSPPFRWAVDKFYGGKSVFTKAAQTLRANTIKSASSSLLNDPDNTRYETPDIEVYQCPTEKSSSLMSEDLGPQTVEVWHFDLEKQGYLNDPSISYEDRVRMLTEGMLIKDARAEEKKAKAYRTESNVTFTSPDCPGVYSVLMNSGETEECVVVPVNVGPETRKHELSGGVLAVIETGSKGSNKGYILASPSEVHADNSDPEDVKDKYDKWFNGLPTANTFSFKEQGVYLLISEKEDITYPIVVRGYDSDRKTIHLSYMDTENQRPPRSPVASQVGIPGAKDTSTDSGSSICCSTGYGYVDRVVINPRRESDGFIKTNLKELVIPQKTRVVKLFELPRENMSYEEIDRLPSAESDKNNQLPIANSQVLLDALISKSASVRIRKNGDRYEMRHFNPNKSAEFKTWKSAVLHLVTGVGLDQKQARLMLKEAEAGPQRYIIKEAQPLQQVPYGIAPTIPDPAMMAGGEYSSGAPVTETRTDMIPVSGMAAADLPQPAETPVIQPVMNTALEAAGEGQKEVFDSSAFMSLLQSGNGESSINQQIPDLMDALDGVGRLLILFYWRGDEFETRYGKQDLPELEDTLKNVFESVGDLALFLHEKEIRPLGPVMDLNAPSVESPANM